MVRDGCNYKDLSMGMQIHYSSSVLKARFKKNGVNNVVNTPIITSTENTSGPINPCLKAISAITSSMMPLAFNPTPNVKDTGLLRPASLPPKYPPVIFESKETAIMATSSLMLWMDEKENSSPMLAKNIGARNHLAILLVVLSMVFKFSSPMSDSLMSNDAKNAPTIK